jgi:hypothetical protein
MDWLTGLVGGGLAAWIIKTMPGWVLLVVSALGMFAALWKHRSRESGFTLWSVTALIAVLFLAGAGALGALILLGIIEVG